MWSDRGRMIKWGSILKLIINYDSGRLARVIRSCCMLKSPNTMYIKRTRNVEQYTTWTDDSGKKLFITFKIWRTSNLLCLVHEMCSHRADGIARDSDTCLIRWTAKWNHSSSRNRLQVNIVTWHHVFIKVFSKTTDYDWLIDWFSFVSWSVIMNQG